MAEHKWWFLKDEDTGYAVVPPSPSFQGEVILQLQFRDENDAWISTYKRCRWDGQRFIGAPVKPMARAKRVLWREVKSERAPVAEPTLVKERDANTLVWHPYPQEIPAVRGHVGTLLVTMQGEEHTYLDTAVWLGAESGFWLNHGRKSDILAWAFAPALYAGEAGNPSTEKTDSADNPHHMTACRIRCLARNLIQ